MLQHMLLLATKSAIFHYPSTPLAVGIVRIHTPEHIAATHPFTFPYFKPLPLAAKPVLVQGCALVAFDYEIGLVPQHYSARMFTNNPFQSSVFVMDDEHRPCFYARLSVSELGRRGHTLHIETTSYAHASLAATVFAPAWWHFMWWEYESLGERYVYKVDHNLHAYRRLVLRKYLH